MRTEDRYSSGGGPHAFQRQQEHELFHHSKNSHFRCKAADHQKPDGLALERVPLAKLRKLQIFLCLEKSAARLQHVGLIAYAGSAPLCSADVAVTAEYLAQLALSVLRFAYIGYVCLAGDCRLGVRLWCLGGVSRHHRSALPKAELLQLAE
ncbi:hypothetical protein Nepgr_003939 [Nepenthes gracilis]|uniref:Uncharacterized protein n=1 Tax=Nepenthes gracilis TaxID=150966 RepID=A0AAD3XEK6_NEPGR|nr:hypothetical protein Nepgr_003939 [Nepenthes gracilis]